MRRAFYDTQWMHDANGQCFGLILGYDFCAEHEFGVSGIHRNPCGGWSWGRCLRG